MQRSGTYIFHKQLWFLCCLSVLMIAPMAVISFAQGTNQTGNGGKHTIQGKIYLPSGQRLNKPDLKIRLESMASGDLTVFADTNGTFAFKNLTAGSYYVVIQGFEPFRDVRESAYIDDPGNSSVGLSIALSGTPKTLNLPIHLEMDRKEADMPPGVVSAELSNAPEQAAELFKKASRSSASGNTDKAIAELKQAIEIYPQFSMAYNELGRLYGATGQRERSIESWRAALKISPNSLDVQLNLGCGLAETNNGAEAATYLNEAIKLNANSIRAFYCMGRAQMQMQNMMYAERALSRSIQLNGGSYSKAHFLLGSIYSTEKKYPQAVDELEKYLKLEPNSRDSGRAHYMLGGIYWSEKKYQKAADELEKYLKLAPDAQDAVQTRKTIAELRSKQN